MTIKDHLKDLGLRDNEASVYLAILQLGETMIGPLEKETDLHKQLIYMAANSLQKRGLVEQFEVSGRKHFKVSNPAALEDQVKAKLARAKDITSRLFELQSQKTFGQQVRVYRGERGFLQYNLEGLRSQPKGSDVLIINYKSSRYFEVLSKETSAFARYERLRLKRNIGFKQLTFASEEEEKPFYEKRKRISIRQLSDQVQPPMDIAIFYNRVGLYFYEGEARILDLPGQETVKGFKSYFELLWKQAKSLESVASQQ